MWVRRLDQYGHACSHESFSLKDKYWRGFRDESGWEGAPVLEFVLVVQGK